MDAKTDKKNDQKTDAKDAAKSPVHRSPHYPAFTLDEAIKKAKILWDKDHKVGAHKDVVLKHLGYTTESGTALRTLATLKRFDLTTEKEGRITVSQRALDILVYPESDERRSRAIKEAALSPSIYKELYSKYRGAFPSDETLTAELIREKGFNPKQVSDFLEDFRATLKFAGLDHPVEDESLPEEEGAMEHQSQPANVKSNVGGQNGGGAGAGSGRYIGKSYSVPLKKKNEATLSFRNFPLEKADLQLIKQWLELMEENLTEQQEEQLAT